MFDLVPFRSQGNIAKKGDAFDRLFDYFLEQPFSAMGKLHSTFKVDVKDNGSVYELVAELPGIQKEDIALQYENNYLTITAKREEQSEDKNENYVCRERHFGSMQRSFFISDIARENITAEFKDGVLKVALPKVNPNENYKQIEIH
ncbi:Hsp20/alpha crystallin family protein [Anaerosinus massiliensis]|uniref:Hsp20/alpha crystallin family protein n=1 Tax=Massilibacillus massiliensis TaxID=1806837 RepID=UPI000DA62607|nr:Hsp20/alpha crystallin family protein [Massilibacillus massiliensis]